MKLAATHRRIVIACLCGIVAVAGAAVLTRDGPRPAPDGAPGPRSALQTIDLRPVAAIAASDGETAPASSPAAGPRAIGVPQRRTQWFSLVGATWNDPGVTLTATVQVRVRRVVDGRWTAWRTLDADEPSAVNPGMEPGTVRGSTDPLWVGDCDGVQARVIPASDGEAPPLPEGLRIDLIDPGDATATPAPTAGTAGTPARPTPMMVTRTGWQADDSIVQRPPEYTSDVRVVFVHHTAGDNDYDCVESARIVRGIQAYHVRSKGWNDIGYNFLVDRCGTLFEGRKGGASKPVLGAHTLGFNTHAAGIAVIGDHTEYGLSAPARLAVSQGAAYKLGTYGFDPTGRVRLTSAGSGKYAAGVTVTMNRISGHRDAVPTTCPGNGLYGQLPAVRAVAAGPVAGLTVTRLLGATQTGAMYHTQGTVTANWSTTTVSPLISRFDVLVDGQVAAVVPATRRSAELRLTPGRHSVQVRAVHLSGRISSTSALTVAADQTASQFVAAPAVDLRRGSLHGSVPVTLGWRAADSDGIRHVVLSGPVARTFPPASTRWDTTARPGVATTWRLAATDLAGNTASATVTRTPVVLSEAVAAHSGSWVARRTTAFLGGAVLQGSAAGASLTWTFTGRSASLAFTRTTRSGRVRILVDGRPAGAVDLRATSTVHRQALWTYNWRASAAHAVTITVEGTAGRPGVISDGLVYLR